MARIAERLARLESRAELEDLVVRYFIAVDGDDLPSLTDCFARDARFSIAGWVGGNRRTAVIDFLVGERAKMGLTLHTPHYGLFTFTDSDHASGLVGAHLELVLAGVTVLGAVRYQDDYVREEGRWRILTRDMRTIYLAPWTQIDEAFASIDPVRWPGMPSAPSDFPRPTAM